jgi:surface antigen
MKQVIVLLSLLALVVGGCASGPKEGVGTLVGAGTGALLGAQVGSGTGRLVAVAIGTMAGALMGQGIGRSLDRADQLAMQQNAQYALEYTPTKSTTPWRNPDSGNSGSITPIETYQAAQGQYCREYVQTVYVGGEKQQAYGTACRQADGSWKIIR